MKPFIMQRDIQKLFKDQELMLNIGSLSSGGKVINVKDDMAKISLYLPVCTSIGEKIAISRKFDKHWRLIGWGKIMDGTIIEPTNQM
ncbi:hypothetical protein A3Q56_06054 [Intoshia linei]|uniref:Initiation factor eIF2 gamma C-terminal domain-containing protein n=1 Tax=Intoshia linei TaxID=1819745 RepID=A0A177AW21_9BILA|nr:hypothetical protein A3Q56_06054 [Intoshia linei]